MFKTVKNKSSKKGGLRVNKFFLSVDHRRPFNLYSPLSDLIKSLPW